MILRRPVLLVFVAAIIGAPVSIWPDGRTVSARERSTAATATTAVQQPVAEDVFDDTRLHDVRLFINSKDLAILRARYRENINTPADIQIDGTRVRNVAVRSRGGGSRNPTKMGLRVDFNFYTANRRFRGLEALVLDNLWQDDALIREALTMKIFRRMGEPAPRESFCRLFLNNQYQGLYALVEEIDGDFAERETGESRRISLRVSLERSPFTATISGPDLDDLQAASSSREPTNPNPDEELYGPIRDLFHNVNEPDDALWLERDRPAARPAAVHEDASASRRSSAKTTACSATLGMNNFYLFRSPGTAQAPGHSRGIATCRSTFDSLVRRARAQRERPVPPGVRATPNCAPCTSTRSWPRRRSRPRRTGSRSEIDRLAAQIDAAAREDTRKQYTNEQFDAGLDFLRQIARDRPQFLIDEIARLR